MTADKTQEIHRVDTAKSLDAKESDQEGKQAVIETEIILAH